jgi:hypothetical protein
MIKHIPTVATALFFGLVLATGGAFAGDGTCTKGKKGGEDGGTAAVIVPAQPLG